MKVKSESEVPQSCPTLRDPMDCSLPGSSIHGILQARVLEWGAIAFSKWNVGSVLFCVVLPTDYVRVLKSKHKFGDQVGLPFWYGIREASCGVDRKSTIRDLFV